MILRLGHGPWEAVVRSDLGGALLALRHDGRDVMRPAADNITNIIDAASFPLVPYANRIAHGRFSFRGQEHRLPPNFGDHPHALHGVGWRAPWSVAAVSATAATLTHEHDGGPGWPYAYKAEQRITLTDDCASFTLRLKNSSDNAMPVGLGFHPAFPTTNESRLAAAVEGVWLAASDCLPTEQAPGDYFADWNRGAAVLRDDLVDHCHYGWNRAALICQPDMTVKMVASDALDHLHIYTPPGRGYFCAEPVSHMPNALNQADATMPVLEPGEETEVSMVISVYSPADRA